MTTFVLNGKTYDTADFPGYGWVADIVAGTGDTLPRWVAALVDGIAEAARLRTTTSASSITVASSGTITAVCATDVQFVVGSDILVTDNASKQIWATVTAYNATTKIITATAYASSGSGSGTSWTVTTVGRIGATGAAGSNGTNGTNGSNGAGFLRTSVLAGGTANALTGTFSPTITTLADRDLVLVEALSDNTSTATFNPDGLGATAIKKAYNNTLAAGDIKAGMFLLLMYDAANTCWQLVNPTARNTFWIGTYINAGPAGTGPIADGDYLLNDSFPFPAKVKTVRTVCASGTATITTKINTTALGGTANSASTTATTQAHSTSNSIATGDDLKFTLASNAACTGLYVMYEMEYV